MKALNPKQIAAHCDKQKIYQSLDSVRISEPRLEMIHKRLKTLLEVVQLESDGEAVEIDGFRLRLPEQWKSRGGSIFSELWGISTACNMRCPFCYEEGDPEELSALNEPAQMTSISEIDTRIKHRDSRTGAGVFQPLTYTNEIFCNPNAMEIIEKLREQAPEEVLTFVTNGTYFTEEVVAQLSRWKPIFFNFSVNSLDPTIRRKVLRDLEPEIAINALELLRKYEIPYLGSLVCWPSIPWSDIKNTVRELDKADCAVIRYSLPAYSRSLKGKRFKFDRDEFWGSALEVANDLINEVETPIKIEPYHITDSTFIPNVAGVLKGSPAARMGIGPQDKILAINDASVETVNKALSKLTSASRASDLVTVKYYSQKARKEQTVVLDENADNWKYPYKQMRELRGFDWGLILIESLKFRYLKEMKAIVEERNAKRVMLCTSELMKPIVSEMINASKAFRDIDLILTVPKNTFFGGTVSLGDLLVVSDYVSFINNYVSKCSNPIDLVFIPSSPFSRGEWGRDLCGVPYSDIQRLTGLPVELIHCRPLDG